MRAVRPDFRPQQATRRTWVGKALKSRASYRGAAVPYYIWDYGSCCRNMCVRRRGEVLARCLRVSIVSPWIERWSAVASVHWCTDGCWSLVSDAVRQWGSDTGCHYLPLSSRLQWFICSGSLQWFIDWELVWGQWWSVAGREAVRSTVILRCVKLVSDTV